MTAVPLSTMSAPAGAATEDRHVVLSAPRPGTIVELAPGSQLSVRFRRRLGVSRWHVAELPPHVLTLAASDHEFQFLVFGSDASSEAGTAQLRFERRHPARDMAHEVCELVVIPLSEGGVRTAKTGSRRSA